MYNNGYCGGNTCWILILMLLLCNCGSICGGCNNGCCCGGCNNGCGNGGYGNGCGNNGCC